MAKRTMLARIDPLIIREAKEKGMTVNAYIKWLRSKKEQDFWGFKI